MRASRMVATVAGCQRTELAYWKPEAGTKSLSVHQGEGALVLAYKGNTVKSYALDSVVTPSVVLPPGHFYTIQAHPDTPKPLVVSSLYPGDQEID